MNPIELKNDRYTEITIPLNRGVVTTFTPDKLTLGQHSQLVNFLHQADSIITRPGVNHIQNGTIPERIYNLCRWASPEGIRYLFAIAPDDAAADATALALYVKIEDDILAEENWIQLDNTFFDDPLFRKIAFAALRDTLVISDGIAQIKHLIKADDTPDYTGGPLGYLTPRKAPTIDDALFAENEEDTLILHGIYRIASSFVYKDGEHSNPGPRSNIYASQWHFRNPKGLLALQLTGITEGDELDYRTAERIIARSFPAQYKPYADDLFSEFYQREEKAGLTGSTHNSSDPIEGTPATNDNHLPPIPQTLIAQHDSLFAIRNHGPKQHIPFNQAHASFIPFNTTRVARILITNPNQRTETRIPIEITIDFSDLEGFTDSHNGHDLIWTDDDGITPLPFEGGEKNNGFKLR